VEVELLDAPENTVSAPATPISSRPAPTTPSLPPPRPPAPRPPLLPQRNWAPVEAEDEPLTTAKTKVPFDSQLWQWRDEGGFVHIKTGELREETDFLDPDAKSSTDDTGDWDEPQSSGDDW